MSSQYYDICIRRARSYCSICYSVAISSTTAASSYGLSAGGYAPATAAASGSLCTGKTTFSPTATSNTGFGDYLDILALQPSTGSSGALGAVGTSVNRICGTVFNAKAHAATVTAPATACSWAVPFKVGVHFDADEALVAAPPAPTANYNAAENYPLVTAGGGYAYSGFYLSYWQNSC